MPTPEPSSPEPETETESEPTEPESMDVCDDDGRDISYTHAQSEVLNDGADSVANTLFANFFESHKKLASVSTHVSLFRHILTGSLL